MEEGRLDDLLEAARHIEMTPEEREEQRRSFAYGSLNIHNPAITRELVDRVADRMASEQREAPQG